VGRKWDCILTLPTPYEVPEIDLAMLFVEAIAAIFLALAISLILLGAKKALMQRDRSDNKFSKPLSKD